MLPMDNPALPSTVIPLFYARLLFQNSLIFHIGLSRYKQCISLLMLHTSYHLSTLSAWLENSDKFSNVIASFLIGSQLMDESVCHTDPDLTLPFHDGTTRHPGCARCPASCRPCPLHLWNFFLLVFLSVLLLYVHFLSSIIPSHLPIGVLQETQILPLPI